MKRSIREVFRIQQKAYNKKVRKDLEEILRPTFKSLKIDYLYHNEFELLDLVVTDILQIKERNSKSKIKEIKRTGSTYLISAIECPECGKTIAINELWNCYFCWCGENGKRIYEIIKAEYPKRKIVQNNNEEEG